MVAEVPVGPPPTPNVRHDPSEDKHKPHKSHHYYDPGGPWRPRRDE